MHHLRLCLAACPLCSPAWVREGTLQEREENWMSPLLLLHPWNKGCVSFAWGSPMSLWPTQIQCKPPWPCSCAIYRSNGQWSIFHLGVGAGARWTFHVQLRIWKKIYNHLPVDDFVVFFHIYKGVLSMRLSVGVKGRWKNSSNKTDVISKKKEWGEVKHWSGRWLVPVSMPLRWGLHSLKLPYILHDMTWEIFGVTIIIPSQILKRIGEESVIDTWELGGATDTRASTLTQCAMNHHRDHL